MARLFSSGFELNSTAARMEWTNVSGSPTISSTTVRSGGYACRIVSLSSGTPKYFSQQVLGSGATANVCYIRFYLYVNTLPSAANTIFYISGGLGTAGLIKLTSSGALQLFNNTSQVGSDSSNLSTGTWYRVEIYQDKSGSAGSHVLTARIDGTNFASSSSLTLADGAHDIYLGGNTKSEAQTVGEWFFDDVAINDNTGSYQNSWPGDGKIIHLRPNAAGDNTDWTGYAGSGSNYERVDEVTPDDNTSGVRSFTTDQIDDYNVEASGLSSSDTINVVSVGFRANRSTGTTSSTFNVRLKDSSGGTVTESSTFSADTTTWRTHTTASNATTPYPIISYTRPDGSNAWTNSYLDTAQIGAKIVSGSGDGYVQISALWMLVDYGAGTPPASSVKNMALLGVG